MTFDAREFRLEVLKSTLDGSQDNFKENVRIIGVIEDKAQKLAGMAGVFLAAALAFIKVDNLSAWPFNRVRILVLLAAAVIAAIWCIGLCLRVLWVRPIPYSISMQELMNLKTDLLPLADGELESREQGYWEDRLEGWRQILKDQEGVISSKSAKLSEAQIALTVAMAAIALLLILVIEPLVCKYLIR